MLVGAIIGGLDETARHAWARSQAYIALGNLLNRAALPGIDACPMEGFDRDRLPIGRAPAPRAVAGGVWVLVN